MTLVRRSGPLGDLVSLRQAMDRLFEDSFVSPRSWSLGEEQLVPLDVFTSDDEVTVQAVLPGVRPEDVDITVEGSTLTISGDTTRSVADTDGSPILQEIRRGRFMRTLSLPAGMEPDKATATFEDGVLTLRIPKAEAVKPRQIRIKTNQDQPTDEKRDQAAPVGAR
jgi:HSP20 family protein